MWSFHNAFHPVKKVSDSAVVPPCSSGVMKGLYINVDKDTKIISMFCGTCSGMLICLVSQTCIITTSGSHVNLQSKQQA